MATFSINIFVCVCVCFERCCAELGNFLEQPLNTNDLLVSSMNKTLFKLNCIEKREQKSAHVPTKLDVLVRRRCAGGH